MSETKTVPLRPCGCGKVPENLCFYGEVSQTKYAFVMGDCCNDWLVEFRNQYATNPETSMARAIECWNECARAAAPSQPADELERLKEAARYFIAEYDDDRLMDRFSIESNEARDALCDLVRIKDHE